MTARRSTHVVGSVACMTIVVYVALVLLAASCMSMSVGSSEGHDHHSQDPSHSPLCAWSCQMVSQSGLTASVQMVGVSLVSTSVVLSHHSNHSHTALALRSSRAPPVVFLG